ncbi:MAG: hypothetical protein ACKV22_27620 [Bryobacteraceae bacterium]
MPRMPGWQQTAEYQEARAKMIRLMSDYPAAYRKFVEVLEKLEDQRQCGITLTMPEKPEPWSLTPIARGVLPSGTAGRYKGRSSVGRRAAIATGRAVGEAAPPAEGGSTIQRGSGGRRIEKWYRRCVVVRRRLSQLENRGQIQRLKNLQRGYCHGFPADLRGIDIRQRLQNVDTAPMIDDPLHRRAHVTKLVRIGYVLLCVQHRVIDDEADEATLGELVCPELIRSGGDDSGGNVLARLRASWQTNHAGSSRTYIVRDQQESRRAIAGLGHERHATPGVLAEADLLFQPQIRRDRCLCRQRSHHALHVSVQVRHATRPVAGCANRSALAAGVEEVKQVLVLVV